MIVIQTDTTAIRDLNIMLTAKLRFGFTAGSSYKQSYTVRPFRRHCHRAASLLEASGQLQQDSDYDHHARS